MNIVLFLLATALAAAALLVGLAIHWSRTPHGRLEPLFALAFGLTRLVGGRRAEGAIDAGSMNDPESTRAVRRDFLRTTAPLSRPVAFGGEIRDRELDGPGGPLPVRIYRPPGAGPFPLMVYLHGGGFVVGSPDYTDAVTRSVALQAPAVVVSVDYRMAPEHPFPAAVDDSCFAVEWCFANADALGARPGRVAVGGDSAGGNLAAVAAQRDVRDGRGHVGLQVLVYPTVDLERRDRESQIAFASGYGLSMKDVNACFARYIPEGADPADPALSPVYAASLAGLPRALVFTAGFDVLRDEGIEYARGLEKAGVPIRHVHHPALPHGYLTMTRFCARAREDIEIIAAEVRALV
ncbi:MAG: alpha/beta hydrolase [Myxococcota bacterium]|nr:alpha/beta hydrolase [Myxococcota bacterium]